jgi:[citrate (pro-3S)-lyase] ligase
MSFYNAFDDSSRVVEFLTAKDREEASSFMKDMGLFPDGLADFILGMKKDGRIVATGGAYGSIIKYLAVSPSLQGEGVASRIVTEIIDRLFEAGIHHQFIYTKPDVAVLLQSMGFSLIGEVLDKVSLLEGGIGSISDWCDSLTKISPSSENISHPAVAHKIPPAASGKTPPAAAVVVNGNPLTKGHLHLLKTAHEREGALHILVVSTEKSLFPSEVRMRLIREETAGWKNTVVNEAGEYVVSMATFPSYFTRDNDVASMQANLDIDVFCRHVVPALSISSRYVGEEPFCPVTSLYNEAMAQRLPAYGVRFVQIPRIESANGAISASQVRQLLREGTPPEDLSHIVPPATLSFLKSAKGAEIIKNIQQSNSRH